MQPERIADLLKPFLGSAEHDRLTDTDLQNILTYIDILTKWNARTNLTAIRSEEEIVTRHFGESLFTASHLFPRAVETESSSAAQTLADFGSGAGFPGIPIKLWAPEISLTLIESNQKKATFLREVIRTLALANVDIKNTRAEQTAEKFQTVTLRAVEHFEDILPAAARLLDSVGRLALLISQPQIGRAQVDLSMLSWQPPIPIPQSNARVLLVGKQESSE